MNARLPKFAAFCITCNRREAAIDDNGRCVICGNDPTFDGDAERHELSVYDQSHPLLVQLVRRRALSARVDAYVLAPSNVIPAVSRSPRDVRIAIARAAASLVLVAQARWLAAARRQSV